MAVTLNKLLNRIKGKKLFGKKSAKVLKIVSDSRLVTRDCLFVAIKGSHFDGHKAIDDVIKKGAVVIVGEIPPQKKWLKGTYIQVRNSREALGLISSNFYNNPSKNLKVIGITGTDGKTTTCNLIWWILKNSSKNPGLISTINAKIGHQELDTGFHVTNPEALDLQRYLSLMYKAKCEYAIIEVTSQGIAQERIAGINFDTAVLTNITHDHFDYHKNFTNYRNEKTKLFVKTNKIVLNKDDASFDYITKKSTNSKLISYSMSKKSNYKVTDITESLDHMEFTILNKKREIRVYTTLTGRYNISNILAAIATARIYKCSWKNIKKALKTFSRPEGRLQEIKNNKGIRIFIDFAHTPNSLELVLKQFKKLTKGRLIIVFGCAGERDTKKRVLMPAISVTHADISVFTAEDPRNERVDDILKTMEESAKTNGGIIIKKTQGKISKLNNQRSHMYMYISIPERGKAIYYAINNLAQKGDIVLICGKGHEKSMAYNNIEYEWSDKAAAQMALKGKVFKICRAEQ